MNIDTKQKNDCWIDHITCLPPELSGLNSHVQTYLGKYKSKDGELIKMACKVNGKWIFQIHIMIMMKSLSEIKFQHDWSFYQRLSHIGNDMHAWGSWSSNTLVIWREEPTHWKRPRCWEIWRQVYKGMTEEQMVGWYHRMNGHEFEQVPGDD